MAIFAGDRGRAFAEQRLRERAFRMESDPKRRLLNATIDQAPSFFGKLALQAVNEFGFGAKKERESQQRYRLYQQALQSPIAREEYNKTYGNFDPNKPPEIPKSMRDQVPPAAAATPAADERKFTILPDQRVAIEAKEGEQAGVLYQGKRYNVVKDRQNAEAVATPDLPKPGDVAPKSEPATLKTYEQLAEENTAPLKPGAFYDEQTKRSEQVRLKADALRQQGRKRSDAFQKKVDTFVSDYNDRAVRFKDQAERSKYVNGVMKNLLREASLLPDPEKRRALGALDTGFARVVGEDVIAFEKGILENYGKVGELSTFAPRVFNNYAKFPKSSDLRAKAEDSTSRALEENERLKSLIDDFEKAGGQKAFDNMGGTKRLIELQDLNQTGIISPEEVKEFKTLADLYTLRRDIADSKRTINDFKTQATQALESEDAAVVLSEETYEMADGTTFRGAAFPKGKSGKLPESRQRSRAVIDAATEYSDNPDKMRSDLAELKKKDPAAFQKLKKSISGKSDRQSRKLVAESMYDLRQRKTTPSTTKQAGQAVQNRAENARRFTVLPAIGQASDAESLRKYDRENNLPEGTALKIANGYSLTDREIEAVAQLSTSSSLRQDQGFNSAKERNKWLSDTFYFKLSPQDRKKLQTRAFTNESSFLRQ